MIPGFVVRKGKKSHKDTICLTPACVHAASEILYNLDPEYEQVDACSDFDQLVCGGWKQRHDMRPDQSGVSTISVMAETSKLILRHVLEGPQSSTAETGIYASRPDDDNFEKLKAGYVACMDEQTIKNFGLEPLDELIQALEKIYPRDSTFPRRKHWPMAGSQQILSTNAPEKLSAAIAWLATFDVDAFVAMMVARDDRDPDHTALFILPPSLGLPSKEYYEDKTILDEYRNVAKAVLGGVLNAYSIDTEPTIPDASRGFHSYEAVVDSVIDLEVQLAKASPSNEDSQNVTAYYNPQSLEQTQSMLPQISLRQIISKLSSGGDVPDRVIVASPKYLQSTSGLLNDTSADVIQALLIWKIVQRYASAIDDPALVPWKRFQNTISGRDPDAKPERWQTCINAVDSQLGWILSKYFVDAAFSEPSKVFGDKIVTDIKTSFISTLKITTWMTPEVRIRAINKVHNIFQKIGYPTKNPKITDPKSLKHYYSSLEVSNSTYFENTFATAAFEVKRQWAQLGQPTNRDAWEMTAPTVNAYFDPSGNEIVFPAGIMQSPIFYDPSVPQYLSYGAFGSVSGHELSHAFDSLGRLYDENGNLTNWWDDATITAFQAKAQCFVDQYSKFSLPVGPNNTAVHVNGRLTLGENIADAGGVAAAFAAWKRHELAQGPDQLLPGLHEKWTKEQLFFVSYATFWCGKSRSEAQREALYRDPHSPAWARTLSTMNNSRDFREAFGCEVKEETCKLW